MVTMREVRKWERGCGKVEVQETKSEGGGHRAGRSQRFSTERGREREREPEREREKAKSFEGEGGKPAAFAKSSRTVSSFRFCSSQWEVLLPRNSLHWPSGPHGGKLQCARLDQSFTPQRLGEPHGRQLVVTK